MPMRVLLIDDHPLFRAGVVAVLSAQRDVEVCAQTDNARDARRLAAQLRPDMAIVDLMLKDDDGLKLVRELRDDFPALCIIVLSVLDPAVYAPRSLQAGASAFISKQSGPEAVAAALRHAPTRRRTRPPPPDAELGALSQRELHVFQQLGLGRSTQEVAAALGVSIKTVESHRENIKAKLDLPHANALVARATLWMRQQGLAR